MSDADSIRLDLPASHKYLNVLGACVTEMLARVDGLAEAAVTAYNVQLALHEACVNIVNHAYAGQPGGRIEIVLTLAAGPRRMVVDIADAGRSFQPAEVPAPDLERPQEHGYGLYLMRALMDEVSYEPRPGRNQWRLVKNLPQAE